MGVRVSVCVCVCVCAIEDSGLVEGIQQALLKCFFDTRGLARYLALAVGIKEEA